MDIVTELNVKSSLLKVANDMGLNIEEFGVSGECDSIVKRIVELIRLLYDVHECESCFPNLAGNEKQPEACDAIFKINNTSYIAEAVEEDFGSEDSSIKDIPTDQYAIALERYWYNTFQDPCLENEELQLVRPPEMSLNVLRDSYLMALERYRHNEDLTAENREFEIAGKPAMSKNVPRDSYLMALERYRHNEDPTAEFQLAERPAMSKNVPRDSYLMALERYRHNEDPTIENKVPKDSSAEAIEHYRRMQPLDDSSIEEQSVGGFSSLDCSIGEVPALRCELSDLNMEYNLGQDLRDTILDNVIYENKMIQDSFYMTCAEPENEDFDEGDYMEMELVRGPAKELVTNDNLDSTIGGKLRNLRLNEPPESEGSFKSEDFLESEDPLEYEESFKSELSFEFGGSYGSEESFKSEVYLEIEQNMPRRRERKQDNCLFD